MDIKNIIIIVLTLVLLGTGYAAIQQQKSIIELTAVKGQLEKKIVGLEADLDDAVLAAGEASQTVANIVQANKDLSLQVQELQKERVNALEAQRKLLSKIAKFERKPPPQDKSSSTPRPVEHYYFDEEMVGLINTDVLGIVPSAH